MSKQTQEAAVKPQKAQKPQTSQQKASLSIDPKYIVRLVGTLTGICLVVSLLLGIVNQVTKPRIDAIQKAKMEAAMTQVLPADEYVLWAGQLSGGYVTSLYRAISGGEGIGYVAETATSGSQGIIEMMVGVDMEGKVTGVSVIKHSETPNIGTKVVNDQSVLDRFIGADWENGFISNSSFDGVSGATYSSRGVIAGVNSALAIVNALLDTLS